VNFFRKILCLIYGHGWADSGDYFDMIIKRECRFCKKKQGFFSGVGTKSKGWVTIK